MMLKKYSKKIDFLIAGVVLSIFWFSLLFLSGTVFSGYHFIDDHEIVILKNDLSKPSNSTLQVLEKWLTKDTSIRFKPFYIIHRVFEAKIFGTNFIAWSIYTGLLALFTSIALLGS